MRFASLILYADLGLVFSYQKCGYLYRVVDTTGQTVDFILSETRYMTAAQRFFTQAIGKRGVPEKMILDGDAASHVAEAEL